MSCEEKARLLERYEQATIAYSAAVTKLRQGMGISTKAEYEELAAKAESARYVVNSAMRALEQHTREHGC